MMATTDMWNRMRAMSDGQSYSSPTYDGGLISQMEQKLLAANQYGTPTLAPARNPMELINPMYTRQAPQNSLAPMGMYQAYKATGQMPAETNSFRSFTPAAPSSGPMASAIQSAMSQPGSK